MGVCLACNAEVAEEQLTDGKCPGCQSHEEAMPASDVELPTESPASSQESETQEESLIE